MELINRSSRGLPRRIRVRRRVLGSLALLASAGVAAAVGVPGATAAPSHLAKAHFAARAGLVDPFAPPPGLLWPGEKVTLLARAEHVYSARRPVGVAYVRRGAHGAFTRLAMTFRENLGFLAVQVPARFLKGSVLEDYVVLRDPAGGKPATLPARGATAPYRSWIVRHPVSVALGTHTFGKLSKPRAIIARASAGSGPGQVGIRQEPEFRTGPTSFDVSRDGTAWIADTVNKRLLVYAPGKPDAPARTVKLPRQPLEVAISPGGPTRGTVYVLASGSSASSDRRDVYAFSGNGKRLWSHPVAGYIFNSVMRVDRDGILWIDDGELGWIPVTSRAGRPLTLAQQTYRTVAYQPIGDGLQLPDSMRSEHELRIGLASTGGTLRNCWRLTSRTAVGQIYPQARVGRDIVAFGEVLNTKTDPHQYEYVVFLLSPAGKVLSRISLDRHLVYTDEPFTDLRVAANGRLYFLQTSGTWGMRLASYNWVH